MKKTLNEVADILYKEDPMGTCCFENMAMDEYVDVAKLIVEEKKDIIDAFEYSFWEGCLSYSIYIKLRELIV